MSLSGAPTIGSRRQRSTATAATAPKNAASQARTAAKARREGLPERASSQARAAAKARREDLPERASSGKAPQEVALANARLRQRRIPRRDFPRARMAARRRGRFMDRRPVFILAPLRSFLMSGCFVGRTRRLGR